MSSYLLEDRNTNFIASAIVELGKNPSTREIVYPLEWRGLTNRLDYFTPKDIITEAKKNLFKDLRELNYMALNARYNDEMPTDMASGFAPCKMAFSRKTYQVLAGVVECYLYQCSEGECPETELFKALKELVSNLYKHIVVCEYGDFDGWADADDLSEAI